MPWFKVDDKLHDHRKVRLAGTAAMGLWVVAGSWCADNLTDGFVPETVARRWDHNVARLAGRLVTVGLWVPGDNDGEPGWWFHDWCSQQPSRSKVLQEREEARKRMSANRARSAERSPEQPPNVRDVFADPDPTRPDPTSLTPPSTDVDKRADPTYRFDDFWSSYPQRKGRRVGRAKALARWKRLSYDDKAAAFRGVAHYRADCDAERTIAKDADRWLRDRCWEDWQDEADPTRSLSKAERRIVDRGHVEGFLEACSPNGQAAITTGQAS